MNAIFFFLTNQKGWKTAGMGRYKKMAEIWTGSVRNHGFTGDIWLIKSPGVYVDKEWLRRDDVKTAVYKPRKEALMNVYGKMWSSEYFPSTDYDKVLGADIDLLATQPIDPLFEMPGDINAMLSRYRLTNTKLNSGLFTKQDLRRFGIYRGINCGVYVCKGSYLPKFEKVWRSYSVGINSPDWNPSVDKSHRTEQHSFNSALFKSDIDFVPFPEPWVFMPKNTKFYDRQSPPPLMKVLHYGGRTNKKNKCFNKIRKWHENSISINTKDIKGKA